jgi:hypothetical protein
MAPLRTPIILSNRDARDRAPDYLVVENMLSN